MSNLLLLLTLLVPAEGLWANSIVVPEGEPAQLAVSGSGGVQAQPPDLCDTLDCGELTACTDNGNGTATCQLPAPPPPPVVLLTTVDVQCLDVSTQTFYVCGTLDLTRMRIPEPAPGTTSPLSAVLSNGQIQVQ